MTVDVMTTMRAIVRDEMARLRFPEIGVVTSLYARDSDGSDSNHQVNVKLAASGVELQRVPIVVSRPGWSTLPNTGDLVFVAFVGGDLNAPVVIGSLYSDQVHPPVAKEHEVVYVAPDANDSDIRRMHVELANGNTFTIKDDTLEVVMGSTTVTVKKDGDIEIKSGGKVSIDADGDFTVTSSGSVSITAQKDISLKASTSATLEGTASATVKGPQVAITGIAQFNPS